MRFLTGGPDVDFSRLHRLLVSWVSPFSPHRGFTLLRLLPAIVLVSSTALASAQSRGLDPIEQSSQGAAANGSYYALVIGIDAYHPPLAQLKTAVDDAKAIGNLLHQRYGFQVTYLIDEKATRFNILDALARYRNTLGPNDNLLIYYAGHGYSDREAQKAYWLPVDADSSNSPNRIIADDLTTGVRVLPSRHVLIVSDSCYSGALSRDADAPVPSDGEAAFLNRMLRSRSRTLMASGGNEPVSDSGSNGHSVFAGAVLRALDREAQPMFTASDLFYGSVRQQVAGKSEQLPQYSIIRNSDHDEGDFVFMRTRERSSPLASPPAVAQPPAPVGRPTPANLSAPPAAAPATRTVATASSLPPLDVSPSFDLQVDTSGMSPLFAFNRGKDLAKQQQYADAAPQLYVACQGGIAAGCDTLGWLARGGLGLAHDDRLAVALFRRACDSSDMHGCNDLGYMHENGFGVAKDVSEAMELFRKACDGAEPLGCENLGAMYQIGRGIGMDLRQAAALYSKACDGGLPSGCTSIAIAYVSGKGVAKDLNQAAVLLRKACDGGDPQGCSDLGEMYTAGAGVPKDPDQAAHFIQKSCDGGNAVACNNLGRMNQGNSGLPKDDARAMFFFKRSCDANYAPGCTNLGVVYARGLGVPRDDSEAADHYKKGCDGGDPEGCNFLAVLYFNGTGVAKDMAQSAALARKACDGGVARGCSNLGLLYESGTGVAKDLSQAEELYHKACEGGFDEGCKNLKRLKP
jgi:TPR repeat protein